MADNIIGEAFIAIRTNLEEFKKDTAKINKEVEKSLSSVQKSMRSIGDSMTSLGKSMSLKVTAPLMAIGAASMAAFSEVDDAMDTIITKTGATGKAAEEMEKSFKNVARSLPASMQEVGDAVGELNTQFGLTGKALEDATTQMIKFAKINNTDVTKATQNAKAAIEAYGLSTKDLSKVLDAATKAAQDTGLSVDEIFNATIKGAPQIKALGLNFAQAAKLMGRFEQQGVDANKALTYLNKAQITFAKDGKTLQQGLAELEQQLAKSKSSTEQLTIASEVFGTKGASFMLDALQRGALDLKGLASAAEDASGTVSTTFEATLDPIDKAKVAMNNLKLVGAEFATNLQEVLAPALDKVVDALNNFSAWFENLPDSVKQIISWAAIILTLIGPIIMIVGQIIKSIAAIIKGVSAVGGAIMGLNNPIGWAIGAFLAGVAIGYTIYKNWDKIAALLKSVWEWIANLAVTIWTGIVNFFTGIFDTIKEAAVTSWNNIKNAASNIWSGITSVITGAMDSLKNSLGNIWDGITSTLSNAWNGLVNLASGIFGRVKDAILAPFRNLHIPLPHFTFSTRQINLGKLQFPIPDIKVEWYKEGGIFTQPAIVGVGEAGTEAVLPINKLEDLFRNALRNTTEPEAIGGVTIVVQHMEVRNEEDIYKISRELQRDITIANRARGLRYAGL